MNRKTKTAFSVMDVLLILLLLLALTLGIFLNAESRGSEPDGGREIVILEAVLDRREFAAMLKEGQTLYTAEGEEAGEIRSIWKNTTRKGVVTVELTCEMQAGVCVPGQQMEMQTRDLILKADVRSAWDKETYLKENGGV